MTAIQASANALPTTAAGWHRRTWALTWPVITSNLSLPLVGAVDTAVMGRFPDPAYIGAVALGAVVFHAAAWMFSFLKQGTTGEVAQAYGAGDSHAIRAAMVRAVAAALIIGCVLAAAATAIAGLGLWLMQGSAEVELLAGDYLRIRLLGAPATLLNLVAMGVLIGSQRARSALAVQLLLNLSNIAFNLWFVVGLGWDVKAVAAASVIAECIAVAASLWLMLRIADAAGPRWALAEVFAPARLRRLVAVNFDIMLRSLGLTAAFFYFNSRSASLGDVQLAANAVLLHFFTFSAYGLDGFAHTAEALAGSAFGSRRAAAFSAAVRYTTGWAALLACIAAIGIAVFGEHIIALLTTQPAVRENASHYLPWLVAAPLLSVWCFQLDGIFIGTLHTAMMRNAMLVAVLAYVVFMHFSLPAFGNHGLWAALMFLNVMRALTLWYYLPQVTRRVAAR